MDHSKELADLEATPGYQIQIIQDDDTGSFKVEVIETDTEF